MENIKANLVIFRRLFVGFLKWCLIGTSVGGIVGLIGAAFHLAISKVTQVRTAHSLLILLLPLCGLAIVFLYKIYLNHKKLQIKMALFSNQIYLISLLLT